MKKKFLVVDRRIHPVRGRGNGCPRLKVLQLPGKKNQCPHECLRPKDLCQQMYVR